MKIFDKIESEADRLMKQEGKFMNIVYLGKKEWNDFVEELLDLQETPENLKANGRHRISESDIIINDDVRVIPTEKDSEFRVEAKNGQPLN